MEKLSANEKFAMYFLIKMKKKSWRRFHRKALEESFSEKIHLDFDNKCCHYSKELLNYGKDCTGRIFVINYRTCVTRQFVVVTCRFPLTFCT